MREAVGFGVADVVADSLSITGTVEVVHGRCFENRRYIVGISWYKVLIRQAYSAR